MVLLLWPGSNNNDSNDHRKPHRAADFRGLRAATTCGTITMIGVALVVVFDSVVQVDFIGLVSGAAFSIILLHNMQEKVVTNRPKSKTMRMLARQRGLPLCDYSR
jgi:hypothetical protein